MGVILPIVKNVKTLCNNEIKLIKVKNKLIPMTFDEVYLFYKKLIFLLAHKYKNDFNEFEDLVQIANIGLIKAFKNYDFNYNNQFSTFMAKCVTNEILMQLRKTNKKLKNNDKLNYIQLNLDKFDIDEIINNIDLRNELKKLSKNDLLVIEKYFFNDKEIKEIAKMTKMTSNGVSVKIRRVVKKIKKNYDLQTIQNEKNQKIR